MFEHPPITDDVALQRARMLYGAMLGVQLVFALAVAVIVQVTGPLEALAGEAPLAADQVRANEAPAVLPLVGAAVGALMILAAWGLSAAARTRALRGNEAQVMHQFQNGSLLLGALLEGAVMLNLILVLLFGWTFVNAGVVLVGLVSAAAGFPTRAALQRWRATAPSSG